MSTQPPPRAAADKLEDFMKGLKMKKKEISELDYLLRARKRELVRDLADNDYNGIQSVGHSKEQQIEAIDILLKQLDT